MKVLGIDIGGTNIRMGMVDEQCELTHYERRPCQEMLGCETAVENLIAAIQEYLERLPHFIADGNSRKEWTV